MSDSSAHVRSRAVKILTASLSQVRRLPRSDANVFTEYILPVITNVKCCDVINFWTIVNGCFATAVGPRWLGFGSLYRGRACGRISGNCSDIPRVVALANSHRVQRDHADNRISWQQCQRLYDAKRQPEFPRKRFREWITRPASNHDPCRSVPQHDLQPLSLSPLGILPTTRIRLIGRFWKSGEADSVGMQRL